MHITHDTISSCASLMSFVSLREIAHVLNAHRGGASLLFNLLPSLVDCAACLHYVVYYVVLLFHALENIPFCMRSQARLQINKLTIIKDDLYRLVHVA